MNVRFGSIADSQIPENYRKVEFGAEEASVSVCLRPIADIQRMINSRTLEGLCIGAGSSLLHPHPAAPDQIQHRDQQQQRQGRINRSIPGRD